MRYGKRILRYVDKMPDQVFFVDDEDVPYDDIDPIELTPGMKLGLAMICIRQKQSLDTVILRSLRRGLRNAGV